MVIENKYENKNTWGFVCLFSEERGEKSNCKVLFQFKSMMYTQTPQIFLLYVHYMKEACETPHLPYHMFLISFVLNPQEPQSSIAAPLIKGILVDVCWILPQTVFSTFVETLL